MNEAFRHISIFAMFVVGVLLWNAARSSFDHHFRFDYGPAVLLVLWSTGVVALFQLLYHYFGSAPGKVVYIASLLAIIGAGLLIHLDLVPLR